MVLKQGDKLHIVTRRLYETDHRRHFVGEVEAVGETAFRIRGYAFVLDGARNEYVRRADLRTRIYPLTDAGLVINVLPQAADVAEVEYRRIGERLVVSDGESFTMDINEFGPTR